MKMLSIFYNDRQVASYVGFQYYRIDASCIEAPVVYLYATLLLFSMYLKFLSGIEIFLVLSAQACLCCIFYQHSLV